MKESWLKLTICQIGATLVQCKLCVRICSVADFNLCTWLAVRWHDLNNKRKALIVEIWPGVKLMTSPQSTMQCWNWLIWQAIVMFSLLFCPVGLLQLDRSATMAENDFVSVRLATVSFWLQWPQGALKQWCVPPPSKLSTRAQAFDSNKTSRCKTVWFAQLITAILHSTRPANTTEHIQNAYTASE